jgi:hypothetical protein
MAGEAASLVTCRHGEKVMEALRAPGPFRNPDLADDMARALSPE